MPVESHPVSARHDTLFEHAYPVESPDLRSLYEKAKRDQWNVSRDIDWSQPYDVEQGVLADEMLDIYGTPFWDRLTPAERGDLNRRFANWRLGILLYGEHGAMLLCSQLVECVSGTDAKFFQATQVVDEARHNEVLNRYVTERLGGLRYPLPDFERELFDTLLSDSRWTVKTIGLQLVAETFAVALFRMLAETSKDPLLRQICKFILQDESRHMGFGMLALPDIVQEASDAERREMEDFTCLALEKVLTGFFPLEAYRDIGFSRAQIDEVKAYRRDVAARNDYAVYRKYFKRDMHTSMVNNLARIGLLTERVRPRLAALGIELPAA
jgi:hypothetical protein